MEININVESKHNIIVIDNFYEYPDQIREFALKQEFNKNNSFPGKITKQFANVEIKKKFQEILIPFRIKITDFNLHDGNNGVFNCTISSDVSWIKKEEFTNMKGIIFLNPDLQLSSGISFYKLKDIFMEDYLKDEKVFISKYSKDITKWELIDKIGNVYNRLILFNSKLFHNCDNYFGRDLQNGRIIQVFFLSTKIS